MVNTEQRRPTARAEMATFTHGRLVLDPHKRALSFVAVVAADRVLTLSVFVTWDGSRTPQVEEVVKRFPGVLSPVLVKAAQGAAASDFLRTESFRLLAGVLQRCAP